MLMYLHLFIFLQLFHGMQTLRGGVDLSHFSNLTVLELRKIPAHLIIGFDTLSLQLKALICSRSIYLLKVNRNHFFPLKLFSQWFLHFFLNFLQELFGNSTNEENSVHEWTELKELNLSYNYLENLDNSIVSLK